MPFVEISGTVLMGRKEPFRNEYRHVPGKLSQAVKVVAAKTAVVSIDVVIGGDGINIGYHRANGIGIVVNLQAIRKDEGFRIGLAQAALQKLVIVLCDHAGPA